MKVNNLGSFSKALQSGPLAPVYLILGKESFDLENAMQSVLKKLPEGSELKNYDGEKGKVRGAFEDLNMLSFFGNHTAVVVRRLDGIKKEQVEAFTDYLKHPNAAATLILSGTALRSNTRFYREAEKQGVVLDLPPERSWEKEKSYPSWVVEQMATKGKRIPVAVSRELVRQVGYDKMLLAHEIEKLACYTGERTEVTLQDMHAICTVGDVDSGWELGSAIMRGDTQSAVRIGRELLKDAPMFQGLIWMIRRQLQTDLQVLSILSSGGTPDEVTREFAYMRGRVLEQHVQAAKRYGMRRFRRALLLIDQVDLFAKSNQTSRQLLFDRLLVQLTL